MKTLKHTLRIPTEMYAYIETEFEGSAEEAVELYRYLTELVKPRPVNELPKKEFDEVVDIYLQTQQIPDGADLYEKMSPAQQDIIQTIKRSFKRTN